MARQNNVQRRNCLLYDVHVNAGDSQNSSVICLLPGHPEEGCESYGGPISNYQCYEKAPIKFQVFRKEHLTDVLLASPGLEMS